MMVASSPHTPFSSPASGWRRARILKLGILVCLVLLAVWYVWQGPQRLYNQAVSLAESDPMQADRLLEEAIADSGGQFPKAQLLRSRLFAQMGLWNESIGAFAEIGDKASLPPQELAGLSELARSARVYFLAEIALEAARHPGPDLPAILRQSIQLHLETGQSVRALRESQELLTHTPDDPIAWHVIGAIHLDQKRLPEAIDALQQAILRTSQPVQQQPIREQLVRAHLDLGNADAARQEIQKLRKLGDASPETQLMEAYVDRIQGKWDSAHATIDHLLKTAPNLELKVRLLRGMVWLDQGKPEPAIEDLELVVRKQPNNKEARNKLAQAYRKTNQPEKALPHAEAAQRLTLLAQELLELEGKLATEPNNANARRRMVELKETLEQPVSPSEKLRSPR